MSANAFSHLPHAWISGEKIHASVDGRLWHLCRPGNLEELWDAMDDENFSDEQIPYWTELWPASLALAHWLGRNIENLRGCPCLDLGCGLGLTAIVSAGLGAQTMGADIDLQALQYASRNALLNNVASVSWACLDWRQPPFIKHCFAHIWAGDIIYEKRSIAPVAALLELALEPGGNAWFADPGRNIFILFIDALHQKGWNAKPVFKADIPAVHIQKELVRVTIWEVGKG